VSNEIKEVSMHEDFQVEGNINSPRTGAFEVTINNKLVFSKFSTGSFPTKKEVECWFK
tara:strand:- start:203 stop:376 length:174 start_codon:yes stop_codon:yes gene_type:complete